MVIWSNQNEFTAVQSTDVISDNGTDRERHACVRRSAAEEVTGIAVATEIKKRVIASEFIKERGFANPGMWRAGPRAGIRLLAVRMVLAVVRCC